MSLDFFPCKIPILYDTSYVYDACNVLVKSYSKSVVATTYGIVLVKSSPGISTIPVRLSWSSLYFWSWIVLHESEAAPNKTKQGKLKSVWRFQFISIKYVHSEDSLSYVTCYHKMSVKSPVCMQRYSLLNMSQNNRKQRKTYGTQNVVFCRPKQGAIPVSHTSF